MRRDNILDNLDTEKQNPNTYDIDTCTTLEVLEKINDEDQKVAVIVREQLPLISKLVDAAVETIKIGGRIFYIGAGTSGRLGILDASECPPTYGVSDTLIQGIIAGGKPAILKAQEGAEDSTEFGEKDLIEKKLTNKDMVIGLLASGRTPYVIGALRYANKVGAVTGSICCVKNAEASSISKYPIEVVTGPEVITGSTRMKAGTAQKLILNMISTATMIKMGKVFHNYMVDVQPTNKKLEYRACRMIETILEVDEDKAKELFYISDKNVKIAIIMYMTKKDKETVIKALNTADGIIYKALELLQ